MRYENRYIVTVCICAFCIFITGIGESKSQSSDRNNREKELENKILQTAKQINSQLPIMVDKETRLDTVIATGKQFHYKYTMVSLTEKEINKKEFLSYAKSHLVKNHCGNDDIKKMLKVGVSYDYVYQDKKGNLIGSVIIKRDSCGL